MLGEEMRQAEIDQEIWRCINDVTLNGSKLTDIGEVKAWHGPGAHELDLDRHNVRLETDGALPLEMYIIPSEQELQKRFDVHVTRIGDQKIYDALEERTVPTIENVLPSHIFRSEEPT